jgi:hypothetical protein
VSPAPILVANWGSRRRDERHSRTTGTWRAQTLSRCPWSATTLSAGEHVAVMIHVDARYSDTTPEPESGARLPGKLKANPRRQPAATPVLGRRALGAPGAIIILRARLTARLRFPPAVRQNRLAHSDSHLSQCARQAHPRLARSWRRAMNSGPDHALGGGAASKTIAAVCVRLSRPLPFSRQVSFWWPPPSDFGLMRPFN